MEKKKQPCSAGKGSTDAKKNQDVSTKPWPRAGRRREPSGGAYAKPEIARSKPVPQRNRTAADKRPRPRGSYCALGGNEGTGIGEPVEAELGSVFAQGSKKQSLNHLLNFRFEPRQSLVGSGRKVVNRGGAIGTFKHKYNKEQFLQANCQFIVKSSGDYKAYVNNPDQLVEWDLIEQVNIHVVGFPACPICLYPPVAAKMTRCGHIYCWSCMLHYLALSDKTWRKCPICYEAVHKHDLKSVIAVPHPAICVDENVTFKLMKRMRGSLIAYPIDQEPPLVEEGQLLRVNEASALSVYSKLLLAGRNEVMSIIERERIQLEVQLEEEEEEENHPEKCFIDQAMALLKEREQTISTELNVSANENIFEEHLLDDESIETGAGSGFKNSKYFYFYQVSDGQHVYMHPLNVCMLEHTHGSLEFCPRQLTGRVVEKDSGSMTDELRKRLRYLQHLPVTCPFEVAEIELRPPIVDTETIEYFFDQIETRRKRRQRRARDEKRREKRIAEEEDCKMGRYAAANIRIESHRQFPDVGCEPEFALPELVSGPTEGELVVGSLESEGETSGLSFAKMLSSKRPCPTAMWPSLKSDRPASSPRMITVTGHNTKVDFSRVRTQSDSDVEPDGYVAAPSFNQSFGDAIAIALEKAALCDDAEGEPKTKSGKKNKRNKQKKVLFATSMAFSSA